MATAPETSRPTGPRECEDRFGIPRHRRSSPPHRTALSVSGSVSPLAAGSGGSRLLARLAWCSSVLVLSDPGSVRRGECGQRYESRRLGMVSLGIAGAQQSAAEVRVAVNGDPCRPGAAQRKGNIVGGVAVALMVHHHEFVWRNG